MFKHLKPDAIAGFLVFLIALPLCLGIAKASGFPPIAGIYTAVIGGFIVTFLTNSQLTIKGPAAGLIVIAVGAVEELGAGDHARGYRLALAVVVVSGVIQVVLGLIKSGKLGDFFPSSVIHGMLAAIGLIIISKQIHIALGVHPVAKDPIHSLEEIPVSFMHMNPKVAVIGLLSMAIMFLHPLIKIKFIKQLPAALIVLAVAIPLGFVMDLSDGDQMQLAAHHIPTSELLVSLPDNFFSGITFPDFSEITSGASIKYIIMFALVGTIESLLSAKAIDSLDPQNRKSNLNRDTIAVGVGNTIAGFVGGLPMISEIVRSSANINNGAKTKMSNFFHGLCLFLFVALAAALIQKIPNAALSAMLVYTGYKLASPAEFKKVSKIGIDQLGLFIVTIVVTLLTDLLVGVGVGILLKVIIEITQGLRVRDIFSFSWTELDAKDGKTLRLNGAATFINYLKLKSFLDKQPRDSSINLDFTEVKFADHTFLENIHLMENEFSIKGGQLMKTGFNYHHFQSNHFLASRKLIVNPTMGLGEIHLNQRQQRIGRIAAELHFEFEPTISQSLVRSYIKPFRILNTFRGAKNLLIQHHDDYSLIICDVENVEIGNFARDTFTSTIAIINSIHNKDVPEFNLEQELLFKEYNQLEGYRKIVPDSHVAFQLFGEDEAAIKKFFSIELAKFIDGSGYDLDSKKRSILIHQDHKQINGVDNYKAFVLFAQELAQKITK